MLAGAHHHHVHWILRSHLCIIPSLYVGEGRERQVQQFRAGAVVGRGM